MAPGGSFSWRRYLGLGDAPGHRPSWFEDSNQQLLPSYNGENAQFAIPPAEVTKVCLRIRHLIEECVPCELEVDDIEKPHSKIITNKVVQAAREAGGIDNKGCVVFCLLVNKRWLRHQSLIELWDADLHDVRAVACEVIAKRLIEEEEDNQFLMHTVLLRRYSIVIDGEPTPPTNVIEKAVDLHAVRVIGSSGYQKCINYLWRGWLVQDENDPTTFVDYKDRVNTSYWSHLDPERMRAPLYQNMTQLIVSIIYLILYTIAVNSKNAGAEIDVVEWLLYIFTAGFVIDELIKLWKVGYRILGFWNAMNWSLYLFLITSFVFRIIALGYEPDPSDPTAPVEGVPEGPRTHYNRLSYDFLAFCAPFFWIRLLLYLDSFRFFGAMLVVLKVMMKESIIFFALLVVVVIGFLQAFIGLDIADDNKMEMTLFIMRAMTEAVLQSPEFGGFDNFEKPFGLILYYLFTFIVMVILLNVLIALYNSAYEDIYQNANDEFMAMFSHKTMQFVRAPDENVYIPPFNLIELFLVALPFEWWMPKRWYRVVNDALMAVIYSPLLVVAAFFEQRQAVEIRRNRSRGEEDDDTVEEWEQMAEAVDFEADGWAKRVGDVKSNVEDEPAVLEVRKLRGELEELKGMVEELVKVVATGGAGVGVPPVVPPMAEALVELDAPPLEDGGPVRRRKSSGSSSSSSSSNDGE